MPKYKVLISPNSILNEEEYEIEAESEDMAKDFAAEKYLQDRASSMDTQYYFLYSRFMQVNPGVLGVSSGDYKGM